MTLAEAKTLKEGDEVYINLGNGWAQYMEFVRLVECTNYGRFTLDDLIEKRVDFSKGKKEPKAFCRFYDDEGQTLTGYYRPRALHQVRG